MLLLIWYNSLLFYYFLLVLFEDDEEGDENDTEDDDEDVCPDRLCRNDKEAELILAMASKTITLVVSLNPLANTSRIKSIAQSYASGSAVILHKFLSVKSYNLVELMILVCKVRLRSVKITISSMV